MQWSGQCKAPRDLLRAPGSEGRNWVTQRGRSGAPCSTPAVKFPLETPERVPGPSCWSWDPALSSRPSEKLG